MADGAEALTGWGGADPSAPDHTTARNPKVAVPALQLAQKSENYDQLAFSCAIDLENAAITMNDEIDAMLQRSRYLVNKQETRNLKLMHRFKRSEEDLDKEIRNIETALDEQEETSLLEGRSRAKSSRGLAHIQTLLETAPSLALRGGKTKVGKTKKVGGKHKGGAIAVGGGRTMTSTPASMLVPSLSSTAKAHAVLMGAGAGAGAGQSGKLKKKKKKAKRRKKKSGAGKKLSPIATRVHASENYVTCFEERDQLLAALEAERKREKDRELAVSSLPPGSKDKAGLAKAFEKEREAARGLLLKMMTSYKSLSRKKGGVARACLTGRSKCTCIS